MVLDGFKFKNYFLSIGVFLVGMFSVSIANIFGGYYCSVAVIETVLFTMFVFNTFDKKILSRENIVSFSAISFITALEVVFFLVNDVFDLDVYVKNNLNFWGVVVIISQLLSIAAIVYFTIQYVLDLNKNDVELVEEKIEKVEENKVDKKVVEKVVEKEVVSQFDNVDYASQSANEKTEEKEEFVEKKPEIRSIRQNTINVKTPFMEEEKQ